VLVPKLATTLKRYTRAQFGADLTAGVIVGIVALPLAIAFAIASGVAPARGLWTAIVAGFIISLLGGSRVQIGGPTGAFVVIVYGIVQRYGIDGLLIATFMAGIILIAMGLFRFGGAIKFIPHPVVVGFTSGIAVIIFSSQVKDFLGLQMGEVPADFVEKWAAFAQHATSINPAAVAIALLALVIIIYWPRLSERIPGPFVALVVTTLIVQLLGVDVETIGSRFGAISARLPEVGLPKLGFTEITALVAPAFTIAVLAAVESLLSAVVADGMIGGRHRSNMELVAQGVANMGSAMVGGIPATGAIARTATNVKNGGRTPVAGIVHAITLLLITLFVGRWAGLIPLAALASILVVVAYNMSEWRVFMAEFRAPKSDIAVLLVTFGLTVLVDLTVAIGVGMVLAAFLFMKRMSEVSNVTVFTREFSDSADQAADPYDADLNAVRRRSIPKGVQVYEVNGPFFFGAAERFKDTLASVTGKPRVLIVRLREVPAIDSTGLRALTVMVRRARKDGTLVLLSDVHAQPMIAIGHSQLLDELGDEQIFGNLDDALNRARTELGLPEVPPPFGAVLTVERERRATGEWPVP